MSLKEKKAYGKKYKRETEKKGEREKGKRKETEVIKLERKKEKKESRYCMKLVPCITSVEPSRYDYRPKPICLR
jgi:hypothetical protein